MRGIKGEKMVRNRKREGGGGPGLGQVKRDRGERKEAISEKECSGDDNMLMMRGAGGKTHSVVVYRLTEPMKGRGERGVGGWGVKATEIQDTHCAPHPRATLSILIRRFGLEEIKSALTSSMPLQIRLDPIILTKNITNS